VVVRAQVRYLGGRRETELIKYAFLFLGTEFISLDFSLSLLRERDEPVSEEERKEERKVRCS
jgi:hypothetical protein